jgi:hypothetical protein
MGWPKAPTEWGVAVYGVFSPDRRSASGEFVLVHYPGCDTVMGGTWKRQSALNLARRSKLTHYRAFASIDVERTL